MKKILLILFGIVLGFSSCKTAKKAATSAYEPAVEPVVVQETKKEVVKEIVPVIEEAPVVVKTEEVTIDKSNDKKLYPFYVIIGSFSMTDNAYKLQDQQISEGIQAVVLKSETGMLRVACLGTDSEATARTKIAEIRKGKEFPDVWLLKTK